MCHAGKFFVTSPRGLGVRSRLATDRSTRRFSLQPAGLDHPRMRVLRLFRVLSPCLLGPILIFIGAGTAPTCEDAYAEHSVIPCVSRLWPHVLHVGSPLWKRLAGGRKVCEPGPGSQGLTKARSADRYYCTPEPLLVRVGAGIALVASGAWSRRELAPVSPLAPPPLRPGSYFTLSTHVPAVFFPVALGCHA
jgi:hypothetical protein